MRSLGMGILLFAVTSASALAQTWAGTYVLPLPNGEAKLTLREEKDGLISGTIVSPATFTAFTGHINEGRVKGGFGTNSGAKIGFNIVSDDGKMLFRFSILDADGKPQM